MESASVFAVCNAMGLKASCVLAVIAHRLRSEKVEESVVDEAERRAILLAIEGARLT
jgi:uridine phosphorylase